MSISSQCLDLGSSKARIHWGMNTNSVFGRWAQKALVDDWGDRVRKAKKQLQSALWATGLKKELLGNSRQYLGCVSINSLSLVDGSQKARSPYQYCSAPNTSWACFWSQRKFSSRETQAPKPASIHQFIKCSQAYSLSTFTVRPFLYLVLELKWYRREFIGFKLRGFPVFLEFPKGILDTLWSLFK